MRKKSDRRRSRGVAGPLLVATLATLALAFAPACGKNTNTDSSPQPIQTDKTDKTDKTGENTSAKKPMTTMKPTATDFAAGHPTTPAPELLAWFESKVASGSKTMFKIPVVIVFKDGFRMSVSKSFIGNSTSDSGDDKLAVELDDGGMSNGLFDQLDSKCEKDAMACAVWLNVTWGPNVGGGPPRPGANPNAHTVAVRGVGDLIADGADAQVMIAK